jgi:hypothetical protein
VHRIIEVAMSDNADLDAAVIVGDAVIAAYATRADRPELPFWPLLFANVTLRLLGSDDFPVEAKQQAARDLTAVAAVGALKVNPVRCRVHASRAVPTWPATLRKHTGLIHPTESPPYSTGSSATCN